VDVVSGGRRLRTGLAAVIAVLLLAGVTGAVTTRRSGPPGAVAVGPRPTTTSTPMSATTTTAAPASTTAAPVGAAGARAPAPVVPTGWTACGGGLQCTTVAVPLDYGNPSGPQIGIAVQRRLARDQAHRIGSLVLNPGGPGDSGIDNMASQLRIVTAGLQNRFDIVEFDPRGVERSSPVHCQASVSPGPPPLQPDPVPQTDETRQKLIDANRRYASDCSTFSGNVLPYVGTDSAARDLDRIREKVGDAQLTFMGQSYGTYLGLVYADLFPGRVRALALDGVIDPSLSIWDMAQAQAQAFDQQLNAFGAWCASTSSCPWRPGTTDTAQAFLGIVESARQHTLAGSGSRRVGPGEVYIGALATLYARTSWPTLGRALAGAAQGNGASLLQLSDRYLAHGSANAADANAAVNCLDHPAPRDVSTYPQAAADAGAKAPVFGPLFAWGTMGCAVWPAPPTRTPHAIAAPGSPPILVVGTTGDPATPYAWAQAVAQQLEHGVLLGRQGQEHVAYFYSACVRGAVERYLVSLAPPPNGTVCSS
jgi:pimeloyl-ACP methyl ester carboxylesterase